MYICQSCQLQLLTLRQCRFCQAVWLGRWTWLPRTLVALYTCSYMHSERCWKSVIFTHILLLLQVTVDLFNDLSLLVHGRHKVLDLLVQQVDVCHPTVTNLGVHEVYNCRCKSQDVRRMCAWIYTLWSMLHISTAANFHESVTAALTAVSKRRVCGMDERRMVHRRQTEGQEYVSTTVGSPPPCSWGASCTPLISSTIFIDFNNSFSSCCFSLQTHTHVLS